MNFKKFGILFSLSTLLGINLTTTKALSQEYQAKAGFKWKEIPVTLAGNGCPPGEAFGIMNGDTVSVTFVSFEAKAAKPKVDSKACVLRMGMDIPSGFTVQPVNVKYIGFADVPEGGNGTMNTFVFFGGKTVKIDSTNFPPNFSSDFEKNVPVTLAAVNACKAPRETVFGINTNLTARAKEIPDGTETQVRLDTIDSTLEDVIYEVKFDFTPC